MVHMLNIHDVAYARDIAEAEYPHIRQFLVPAAADLRTPQQDFTSGASVPPTAEWQRAVGENVRPFSAVAYFFATQIYEKHGVPIGIINASVGGTPIEAWTSEAGLSVFPEMVKTIQQNKDTAYVHDTNRAAALANAAQPVTDQGMASEPKWFDMDKVPAAAGWRAINVPGYWEDQGIRNLDGIVWYRKAVEIPP